MPTININKGELHWNYFLTIEQDLEKISRYIEFTESNYSTFSIELARILFAASSEVDVLAKGICKKVNEEVSYSNIDDYREIITYNIPEITEQKVHIRRYGISVEPWKEWKVDKNPGWWRSYNNVKHERNEYFSQATLINAIRSLGGLLIFAFFFYGLDMKNEEGKINPKKVTTKLQPESQFLSLNPEFYRSPLYIS